MKCWFQPLRKLSLESPPLRAFQHNQNLCSLREKVFPAMFASYVNLSTFILVYQNIALLVLHYDRWNLRLSQSFLQEYTCYL